MYILYLPLIVCLGLMEGQYGKEFCGLKDLRHKLVRLQHHEKVYTRSLEECVTPKGLRLKKLPMLGKDVG